MKSLVLGSTGQVGRALLSEAPAGMSVIALSRAECDFTDAEQIANCITTIKPDLIFNAAAYTAVDAAETDVAKARLVNATAVGQLGAAAKRNRARLVHVSSDFVFDGASNVAYRPDDKPNPLNTYGQTKLEGEQAARAACPDALIVRTAWVYAEKGRNFVQTMLKLMAERDTVRVVADQIGTPTYATNLARGLWALAEHGATGLYHYTDSGIATWYDLAIAIQDEAQAAGILKQRALVVPIATVDYPTAAKRPVFSALDCTKTWKLAGGPGAHWRRALRQMLGRMNHG